MIIIGQYNIGARKNVPSRFTTSNNTHNLKRICPIFKSRDGSLEETVMKVFYRFVATSKVKVLTNDDYIDGVTEVRVEDAWVAAVGEHFLNLKGAWVRHVEDGLRHLFSHSAF